MIIFAGRQPVDSQQVAGVGCATAMMHIGKAILRLRQEHDWTLAKLSEASGVSMSTLSKMENGKTRPDPGTLEHLAAAFKMDGPAALYAKLNDLIRHTPPRASGPQGAPYAVALAGSPSSEVTRAEIAHRIQAVIVELTKLAYDLGAQPNGMPQPTEAIQSARGTPRGRRPRRRNS